MLTLDSHSQVHRLTKGSVIYSFCSRFCLADFRNGIVRKEEADDLIYGCWFCGSNLIEGLALI